MQISSYEQRLARLACEYSVTLKKGDVLLIKGNTHSLPLIQAIYKHALQLGALPYVEMDFTDSDYMLYKHGDPEVITKLTPWAENMYHNLNALITIFCTGNSNALKNIDHDVFGKRQAEIRKIRKIRHTREAEGLFKWTIVPYVNEALAQNAGMSLEEYSDFVFEACKLNDSDPIESWKEVQAMQDKVIKYISGKKTIRIVGEKTDATFSLDGRKWINCCGLINMPDGEVFTSPVENSANGYMYFDIPSTYNGVEAEGIYLEFKDGIVVHSEAKVGDEFVKKMLKLDEGANKVGEIAFGTNTNISKATRNILIDEKIGRTLHIAIGSSYLSAGGKNESGLHWDIIKTMTNGGKVYFDGELVYENGEFLFL